MQTEDLGYRSQGYAMTTGQTHTSLFVHLWCAAIQYNHFPATKNSNLILYGSLMEQLSAFSASSRRGLALFFLLFFCFTIHSTKSSFGSCLLYCKQMDLPAAGISLHISDKSQSPGRWKRAHWKSIRPDSPMLKREQY